ncbi:VOC family protein [Lichenicoccus sp.]|uniref:VOC family protein n=1 Tax=Lichenicoccus sp. TaxID=2781899 RepID=UPI003D0C2274
MAARHLARILGFRLTTQDLPRLSRFYQDVLGFTAQGEQAIAADEMALLGLQGGGRRVTLRMGEQRVAIDQFEAPGRAYPTDSDAASLWFQHLALVVPDIEAAYARLRDIAPISEGGPQHLPPASGGASAYKFRDPDGHPLELLQFPRGGAPASWGQRTPEPGQIAIGIDHSAISVAETQVSVAFYNDLGLASGKRTLNRGPAQEYLDDLRDVEVTVVALQPEDGAPHLELLGYQVPRGTPGEKLRANDVAATRIVWSGEQAELLSDPDGHLQQIEA